MMEEKEIALEDIIVLPGRRPVDAAAVDRLVESIKVVGLENAIKVALQADGSGPPYTLIFGAHRTAAHEKLGKTTIRAKITSYDPLRNELDEIIDNLHHHDLTGAERINLTMRYGELLDALEERTQGVSTEAQSKLSKRGRDGEGRPSDAGSVRSQAEATGEHRETVRRNLKRGNALKDEMPDLLQTKLSGEALDALVELKEAAPEKVAPIIARARRERVTAKDIEKEIPDDEAAPTRVRNNLQLAAVKKRDKKQIQALRGWLSLNEQLRDDAAATGVPAIYRDIWNATNKALKKLGLEVVDDY